MKNKTKKIIKHSPLARWWRRYSYKHTLLATGFIILFVLALNTALVQGVLDAIENFGVPGIFMAGVMFVSFFTAAPAVAILAVFAESYNPFLIALVAGIGTVIGDWIILRLFEERIAYELTPLAKKFGLMPMIRLLRFKPMRPLTILLGAIFIASPLPDEVGLGLLDIGEMPMAKLLALTFVLNVAGILTLVLGVQAINN